MSFVELFRIVFLSLSIVVCFVDGRNWNSHQVAVGEWKVTLKGGWFFDPSRIFPPTTTTTSTSSTNEIFGRWWNNKDTPITLPTRRRIWGSSLDCSLSINDDGTFQLSPIFGVNGNINNNKNRKGIWLMVSNPSSSSEQQQQHKHHHYNLPIRGKWKVQSNPYCVTDRFYDQLTLISYPRVEVCSTTANNKIKEPVRSIQLCLAGRMWGRYSKPKDRLNGRITHGSLIRAAEHKNNKVLDGGGPLTKTNKKAPQQRQSSSFVRPVWASFSATRSSRIPSIEGWDDQRYFGY